MQLSRTLGGCSNVIHGLEFPRNAIILKLDNGVILVCKNFNQPISKPLELYCYMPTQNKWVRFYAKNEYTEMMWDYYNQHKHKKSKIKYSQLMHHDRRHKKGGGRIPPTHTVTDYECRKNPLHDFRYSRYI